MSGRASGGGEDTDRSSRSRREQGDQQDARGTRRIATDLLRRSASGERERAISESTVSRSSLEEFETDNLHETAPRDAFQSPAFAVEHKGHVGTVTLAEALPVPPDLPSEMANEVTTKNRLIMKTLALKRAHEVTDVVKSNHERGVKQKLLVHVLWRKHLYKVVTFYRRIHMTALCPEYLEFLAVCEALVLDVFRTIREEFTPEQQEDLPYIHECKPVDRVQAPMGIRLKMAACGEAKHFWIGAVLSQTNTNRVLLMADCLNLLGDIKRYQAEHVSGRSLRKRLYSALRAAAKSCYQASMLLNPTFFLAYNKLAIFYEKVDAFGALYHYARCMAVKKPLEAAREAFVMKARAIIPETEKYLRGPPSLPYTTPRHASSSLSPTRTASITAPARRAQATYEPVPASAPDHRAPRSSSGGGGGVCSPFDTSMWVLPTQPTREAEARLKQIVIQRRERAEREWQEAVHAANSGGDASDDKNESSRSSSAGGKGRGVRGRGTKKGTAPSTSSTPSSSSTTAAGGGGGRVGGKTVRFSPFVGDDHVPTTREEALWREYSWPHLARAALQHFDDPEKVESWHLEMVFAGLMALIYTKSMEKVPEFLLSANAHLVLLLKENTLRPSALTKCSLWICIAVELAKKQYKTAEPKGSYARSSSVGTALHILCHWLRLLCAYVQHHYEHATPESVTFVVALPAMTALLRALRNNASIAEKLEARPMYREELGLADTMVMVTEVVNVLRVRLRRQVQAVFEPHLPQAVDVVEKGIARLARHTAAEKGAHHRRRNSSSRSSSNNSRMGSVTLFSTGQEAVFPQSPAPAAETPEHSASVEALAAAVVEHRPETLRYLYIAISRTLPPLSYDFHVRGIECLKTFYRDHNPAFGLDRLDLQTTRPLPNTQAFVVMARLHVEFAALAEATRWVRFIRRDNTGWRVDVASVQKRLRGSNTTPAASATTAAAIDAGSSFSMQQLIGEHAADDGTDAGRAASRPVSGAVSRTSTPRRSASELSSSQHGKSGSSAAYKAMQELRSKHRQLRAAEANKQQALEAIKQQKRRDDLDVVVVVSVVVPDTNCFLKADSRSLLTKLRDESEVSVVIPTMVICELRSMHQDKKGQAGTKRPQAERAFDFLSQPQTLESFKAVNEAGSRIPLGDALARGGPAMGGRGNNDAVILATAERLSENLEQTRTIEGEVVTIKPVVLLSNDNNLRIRAHAQQLPQCNAQTLSTLLGYGIPEESAT